jgi:ubiquinone/menaquinone biosynthesis C-methylase UbiE
MRRLYLRAYIPLNPGTRVSDVLTLKKNWDAHVADAEAVARGDGFQALRDRIVELGDPRSTDVAVDIGSGTGLLTLVLGRRVARVWAIDSSAAMNDYLRVKAASAGLTSVEAVTASAVSLPLVDESADLIVSNYCFHELSEPDKRRALAEVSRVLKPDGRLVIGDMMFSLNPAGARDRRVVAGMLRKLARRGLPGVWRLVKNAGRLLSGRGEHPANAAWWGDALRRAGFSGVTIETLPHEGGIAVAEAPSNGSLSGTQDASLSRARAEKRLRVSQESRRASAAGE